MNKKQRVSLSVEQKLEYAKLMVNEGYTNQQINKSGRYRAQAQPLSLVGNDSI